MERAPGRAGARGRVRPGLGQPRGQPAAAAGAARRHHGGGRLSLADPAPLRGPGGAPSCEGVRLFFMQSNGGPGRGAPVQRQGRDPVRPGRRHRRRRAHGRDGRARPDHRLRHGRHQHRRRALRRRVRARVRDRGRRRADAGADDGDQHGRGRRRQHPAFRRRPRARRAGQRRRQSGPGLLPPRRAADGDGRQCLRRQDPARAFPGDLRTRRRRSRSTPTRSSAEFAELAARRWARPTRARRPKGFLRVAVANMANAIKQVSVQKGHDADPLRAAMLRRRRRPACLPGGRRARDGDGVHPPLCRRAVRLRHGAGRPGGAARAGGRARRSTPRRCRELERVGRRAGEAARAGAAGAGRRRRRGSRCGGRCTCATPAPRRRCRCRSRTRPSIARGVHRGAPGALRLRHAGPARWSPSWSRSRRWPPGEAVREPALPRARAAARRSRSTTSPMWSGGREHRTPVFERTALRAGDRLRRPGAGARGERDHGGRARLDRRGHARRTTCCCAAPSRCPSRVPAGSDRPDPVLLELFNNLFMNVAEQTGAVLQNTSLSVNIKERLDFSCAIFDAEGDLVANAPHVPVHLGAMGESVRTVLRSRGATLAARRRRGAEQPVQRRHASAGRHRDHPGVRRGRAGDPVLRRQPRPSCRYRRHHARAARRRTAARWRTRASSSTISCWSTQGHFREAEFRALLAGAKYPARSPDVNVADIKAQVAANERGVQELARVVHQFGWDTVQRLHAARDGQCRGERAPGASAGSATARSTT